MVSARDDTASYKTNMLFAGWEVRIVKNRDRGLENARSQFFTIRIDPRPANNLFIFSSLSQINLLILSLPPAQTRRALQMR